MNGIFTVDMKSLIRNSSSSKIFRRDAPKYTEIAPPNALRYDHGSGYFLTSSTNSTSRVLKYTLT